MIRGRWIFDRTTGELVPADEFYARKYADVQTSALPAPMVIGDVQPYRSMVDGSIIGGRRQHRDHLKAHGCIEVGNETLKPRALVGPKPGDIAAQVKRAMDDEGLRAEALTASKRAKQALAP